MLTNIYHIEHFHQTLISRIRFPATAHLFLSKSDITRIFQSKLIILFDYGNAIFSIEIRIDNAIRRTMIGACQST